MDLKFPAGLVTFTEEILNGKLYFSRYCMAEAHSEPCQTWKIEHFAKYFITRILSRTFFNASKIYMNIIKANTGKNAFGKTIYTNWNNKI